MNNVPYIFTEIVNCGKIGKIALDSFHKYHNHKVHIFGRPEDFKWILSHQNNIFIEVDGKVLKGYESGHVGTALLWEKIIRECPTDAMIHFDSDVIFRANIIDEMIEKSKEYDLIGPIRNYHHNPNGRDDVRYLADLCQTNCTLFKKSKISANLLSGKNFSMNWNRNGIKNLAKKILRRPTSQMSIFAQMIHGSYSPFKFNVIDFFDPVMFDMINNGAKIFYLNHDEVGGCDRYGKRDNAFKEINNFPTPYKLDFGSKLSHFSCVGSGMNFSQHPELINKVGPHYFNCALDRYALFCKIFYGEDTSNIDLSIYKPILDIKNWY